MNLFQIPCHPFHCQPRGSYARNMSGLFCWDAKFGVNIRCRKGVRQYYNTTKSWGVFHLSKKVDYHFLMTCHHCWIISLISKSVYLVRVQKYRQIWLDGCPQLNALLQQLKSLSAIITGIFDSKLSVKSKLLHGNFVKQMF